MNTASPVRGYDLERSKLSTPTWIAVALVVIGALNWGLIGAFRFDLVAAIFGQLSVLSRVVYLLVALAGIYLAVDSVRLREVHREVHRTR